MGEARGSRPRGRNGPIRLKSSLSFLSGLSANSHAASLPVGRSLTVAIFAIPVFAADFAGTIVVLIDGDTIEVPHNHHSERIRLNGIDCPAMRAI